VLHRVGQGLLHDPVARQLQPRRQLDRLPLDGEGRIEARLARAEHEIADARERRRAVERVGVVAALLFVFTLMLADFFDTMGTMTAIGAEAELLDEEGVPPNTERILIVDSIAAAAGGAAGVSSNTSYIESASGVGEGARTGLPSVVTGVLFLLAIFAAPLVEIIPSVAAVPALVLVGFLMLQQIKGIDFDDMEIAIPAFLTIVLMPFTYSITAGIGAGFLAYTLIKVVRGKAAEVHVLMWVVSALFVLYFAIDPVTRWLT
jgi:AGZA family xanthine/uracil permease-like MFS transporter